MPSEPQPRLIAKPNWVMRFEQWLARLVPVHPHILSGLKMLVVMPLLLLSSRQAGVLSNHPVAVLSLFAVFAALDYLDGVIARLRGLETWFGRFFDRLTDLPMLIALSLLCHDVLPLTLLLARMGLDIVLLILYLTRRSQTESRLRSILAGTTLLTLLIFSQGWAPRLVSPLLVRSLLWLHIAFSTTIILFNLRVFQKRFLADLLSGINLACGVFSMIFALHRRPAVSLLFLLIGAACDGLDGAAARRFGSTRWGVYSDDVADGVNYGLAPGVALIGNVAGVQGWVLGIGYILLTLTRLVFFTLNKKGSDPNFFCGIPSTTGAVVALSSLIVFGRMPVLLGALVGLACVQMVAFDTHYRHLGRALGRDRRYLYGLFALILVLVIGTVWGGVRVAASCLLVASLVYGFTPTVLHFRRLLSR